MSVYSTFLFDHCIAVGARTLNSHAVLIIFFAARTVKECLFWENIFNIKKVCVEFRDVIISMMTKYVKMMTKYVLQKTDFGQNSLTEVKKNSLVI